VTTIDWAILAVLLGSGLLGLWRGFIREVLSVVGWVGGVVAAFFFAEPLGRQFGSDPSWAVLRTGLAAVLIVTICVFAAAAAGWFLHKLITVARLSGADRALGGVFGFARGVLLVFLAVLIGSRTTLTAQAVWRESMLLPPFESGVRLAAPHLPSVIAPPKLP